MSSVCLPKLDIFIFMFVNDTSAATCDVIPIIEQKCPLPMSKTRFFFLIIDVLLWIVLSNRNNATQQVKFLVNEDRQIAVFSLESWHDCRLVVIFQHV